MILINCISQTQPLGFLLVGQDMTTYELLGFSPSGTPYKGDLSRFRCSTGTSNQLGTYEHYEDLSIPPTLTLTEASIRVQFNSWQDKLREDAYTEESDKLLKEAWRKEIDPKSNGSSRGQARIVAIAKVDEIKLRYPKV